MRLIFLLAFPFIITNATAQIQDSNSALADSLHQPVVHHKAVDSIKTASIVHHTSTVPLFVANPQPADSLVNQPVIDTAWIRIAAEYVPNFLLLGYQQNRFFNFSNSPVIITTNKKEFQGKELMFYAIISILLLFALIRASFPKYFVDLFRVAFRTTLKQRQIGEQLIQTPLPSLLLNFFFLVSGGLYLDFVLQHFGLTGDFSFWLLYFYCFVALMVTYIIKFLSLKFSGWLFNITPTTDGYIFIVFMINKIIGIYLLPFIVLLAFTDKTLYVVSFTLSYLGVFALLAYRFILSYGLIKNQMRLNSFHFFLYLCAFEVVPLFLVYKALMLWFLK